MRSLLAVVRILGAILMTFSVAMQLPLWFVTRRAGTEIMPRDGMLLVSLAWTVLPAFACLPLILYFEAAGRPISITRAYFEAVSGLTTTGATVRTGLDALPLSINLWRCFLQWLGGMGILVLTVAILPLLGVGGSQLFKAEAAGPMKDAKLTPRIAATAKGLWAVYFAISLACFLSFLAGGMGWADALMHTFATMSLSGFSSHDASFGYFKSPLLEWICVVFMLIASCNFALYFVSLRSRSLLHLVRDTEFRATLAVMAAGSLLVALFLYHRGTYTVAAEALRLSFFNVVSIASTTGFASTDYNTWPAFAPLLMLLMCGVATSAGSTGAGIKMVRAVILVKQVRAELLRIVHPRVVNLVLLNGRKVPAGIIHAILAFMLLYGMTVMCLTMLLVWTGLEAVTAFSAVMACVNNTGPGLNEVGPAGNFGTLSAEQTWICTMAMLLGRLDIVSLFVLFTPSFWRR